MEARERKLGNGNASLETETQAWKCLGEIKYVTMLKACISKLALPSLCYHCGLSRKIKIDTYFISFKYFYTCLSLKIGTKPFSLLNECTLSSKFSQKRCLSTIHLNRSNLSSDSSEYPDDDSGEDEIKLAKIAKQKNNS